MFSSVQGWGVTDYMSKRVNVIGYVYNPKNCNQIIDTFKNKMITSWITLKFLNVQMFAKN